MRVLINAVSAKLGGAATYIRNLAASLAELAQPDDSFTFVVPHGRRDEMPDDSAAIHVLGSDAAAGSYAARIWWEQVGLRRLLAKERPDVLFSSANFAMLGCPCPQMLLVRIPIYFDGNYLAHVLPAKSVAFRAETALRRWLVCRSVRAADCLMTPTAAMRDDLAHFAPLGNGRAFVNPYGAPRARLLNGTRKVPSSDASLAPEAERPPRLLWVSHYADHKNLATLLRATEILRRESPLELWLTLNPALQTGQHTALQAEERELLKRLGDTVRFLGVQSYDATWALYLQADVFVFPSLCESFGHPLVEAMGSGLPVVASDIAVHREICGDAAQYFGVLDAPACANVLRPLLRDASVRQAMAARGRQRVLNFVWEDHVTRLLDRWQAMASRQDHF